MSGYEQSRRRIIARCTKIVDDTEQLIRDVLYWNDHVRAVKWPETPPIDVEPARVVVFKAKEIRQLATDGKPIPDALWEDLLRAAEEDLM